MPPKAAKSGEDGPGSALKVFLSVMKNCDSIKPVWDNVAKEIGIGYGKNAQSKFKGMVEKHGYKFEGGRVTLPGGETGDADADPGDATNASPAVSKTTKTPRTPKTGGNKRKAVAANDDAAEETPTKPAKKKKVAPKTEVVVKEETANDEDVKKGIKNDSDDQANDDVKAEVKEEVTGLDDSVGTLLSPEEAADMVS